MLRMRSKLTGLSPLTASSAANSAAPAAAGGGGEAATTAEWEMRPGGMLVQKRLDSDQNAAPPPTIRVRVKYNSVYHEITISSQATFGELKRKLTGPTGLHHEDQKLLFKDKARDSKAYLDMSGVKDKSKLVLLEDPISQEKRLLEMRKNAKFDKAAKSISQISLEVDRLVGQVSAFESVISNGGRVAEKELLNLIELLMTELVKLDAIDVDGDVKLQRKMQVRRVQKYVEAVDALKIKNSMPNESQHPDTKKASPKPPKPVRQQRQSIGLSPLRPQPPAQTVVTTQWEIFDSTPALNNPTSSPPPLIPLSPTATAGATHPNNHRFNWELFE